MAASCMAMERRSASVVILVFFQPTHNTVYGVQEVLLSDKLLPWRRLSKLLRYIHWQRLPRESGSLACQKVYIHTIVYLDGAQVYTEYFLTLIKVRVGLHVSGGQNVRRNNALSKTSTRLVAAKMITPLLEPKPSISVSNWFNVFRARRCHP